MTDIVLKIHLANSGQWSGTVFDSGVEICGVAGCDSPEDVQQALIETGVFFDRVEVKQEPI